MKKLWAAIAVFSVFIVSVLMVASLSTVNASPSDSFDVKVAHVVDVRDSGLLVMSDSVTLSTAPGDRVSPLQNYVLGFPYSYQSDLVYAFAYETQNPGSNLPLDLNAGMGRIGFYGVRVGFPAPVDISDGGSYEFTVVFVFSNSVTFTVLPLDETVSVSYNASFPAYPSLPQIALEVDLKVIVPVTISYSRSSYEDKGINLTRTIEGSTYVFNYVKSGLNEFSNEPAWFYASRSGTAQFLDVLKVERRIDISGNDRIVVSDFYSALNKAGELEEIRLELPDQAYDISAFDEFVLIPESNLETQQTGIYTNVTIAFAFPHAEGEEIHLSIRYSLPWDNYVTVRGVDEFHVSLFLFEKPDWAIRELTVTLALPEGAILSSPLDSANFVHFQNTGFSSDFAFSFQNATPFHDYALDFTYKLPIFWGSFRPTIWVSAFVLVVGAVVGAWRVYQPPSEAPLPTAIVSVRAEDLKTFVSRYDEKRRLMKDAESLEVAARKGKIPRRQYKVRKKTIDGRLTSLSRDLAALRDRLRGAGPRFADLMRQLEVAENELQGARTEINTAEIRYRRGDVSPQAYHNILEAAYRRRDRAQTTIDGVLLRLREEIS